MTIGSVELAVSNTMSDQYQCLSCHQSLVIKSNALSCLQCDAEYPLENGIPVFSKRRGYWCNVSREKMRKMIDDAEQSGDWLAAVNKHIERYAPHVVPLYRADAQFMLPINSESRVLDAGSMWGGLTIPIAQFAKTVYAVDQTWETLRFLQVRSKQMGLHNVIPVESSIHTLPFPDNYFDCVIVNGVLEWLAMEQDVVLDKDWDQKRKEEHRYQNSPETMQLNALKELRRVLKPGGGIYVAIENRLGLQYFLGHPDDHMNVRFITFLPRFLANCITKLKWNAEYRTYVYSPNKLRELVNRAGFKTKSLYAVYPHYAKISRMLSFDIFSQLKKIAKQGYPHFKIIALSFMWRLIPEPIGKHFSPSIALVAGKEGLALQPRLLQILADTGLLAPDQLDRYEPVLANNRFGNGHTTNYLIFDKKQNKNIYFCKISRTQKAESLVDESKRLQQVMQALKGSELLKTIPNMLFHGAVDGVTIQVTTYVSATHVSSGMLNGLRCLPRFFKPRNASLKKLISFIQQRGRKTWFKKVNPWISEAVSWLVNFQKTTQAKSVMLGEYVDGWLTEKLEAIQRNGINIKPCEKFIENLKKQLAQFSDQQIPMVMQHGDFDVCNVLQHNEKIFIVDFEHAEANTTPFFDLANLIFSPYITEWKGSAGQQTLAEYAAASGWQPHLEQWIKMFAEQSGMPFDLVKLLPQIAAIEQNAMEYPSYRNPYDYPMFGQKNFEAMMSWNLCSK